MTDAGPLADRAVLIAGGRIVRIAPGGTIAAPRGALRVDGRGRFLLPGLWDMHVHQTTVAMRPGAEGAELLGGNRRYFTELFLTNGITGVRDMAGELAELVRWKREVERGAVLGPRLFVTGWKVAGEKPVVPGAPWPVETPEQVRRSIEMLKAGGADFVKLEAGVTPELYPAVVEASRRAGLPFLGHISIRMDPIEASRLGQRTIEHLMGLPVALSRDRQRLRWWTTVLNQPERLSRWERFLARIRPPPTRAEVKRRTVASFDSVWADAVLGAFVTNGTAQCPTLVLERERAGLGPVSSLGRPEERAVVPWTARRPGKPRPAADAAADSAYFGLELTLVRRMQRAGVTLLAGSDTPTQAAVPGFSLHDELELLVAAGLSPLQALAAATTAPARFLGLADSLGTVEEGKTADLLLLDADPLMDIRHTRRIRAVFARGRLIDRAALDQLMADADSLAAGWRGLAGSEE